MEMSEQIGELAMALSNAQAAIVGASKKSANPFFKSKFADLESVWDACRKPLTDHGLSIVQSPSSTVLDDGRLRVTVTTLLLHASGQWIRDSFSVTAKEDSPQAAGSATTYAKRYALQSFVGVAPTDADDDAEAAQGRPKMASVTNVQSVPAPKGYEDWLIDLESTVSEGTPALEKAWKASKAEYRQYLTTTASGQWDALKKTAAQAVVAELRAAR